MELTKLKKWYSELTRDQKEQFRTKVLEKSKKNKGTFYRYLSKEAPKLIKKLFSTESKISINDLYKTT